MTAQISRNKQKSARFVIEGVWSGYRSSQRRVVHRTVHKGNRKSLRAWVEKTHGIRYTDGTMLYLTVRDCKPRERVQQIRGYDSLINDCQHFDTDSVSELYERQASLKKSFLEEMLRPA